MDEAFDYWYRPKGGNPHCSLFLDTFREDTKAMVQDAYNHPCVVIYSIGNEIPEAGNGADAKTFRYFIIFLLSLGQGNHRLIKLRRLSAPKLCIRNRELHAHFSVHGVCEWEGRI